VGSVVEKDIAEKPQYFVLSLARGLAVLQALADAGRPLTLTEIAGSLGTNKSTAIRFCYTLTRLEYIRRDRQKRYHPTPRVLSLGSQVIRGMDWLAIARHYLERLSEEVKETAGLFVLDGHEVLYLMRVVKERNLLPYDAQIGSKFPVHCSSVGKVLMAFGPPQQTRRILKKLDFRPLTHRTITSMEEFLEELEGVRKKGYAISDEELSVGLRSVAAPVKDAEGRAVVAININVPTKRHNLTYLSEVISPRAISTAQEISKALIGMGWDFEP
jgi:IclR family pca regulon transcriptional regulator